MFASKKKQKKTLELGLSGSLQPTKLCCHQQEQDSCPIG